MESACFVSVGLVLFSVPLTTSQSWPVKGRAEIEGTPQQEPSLVNPQEKEGAAELDGAADPIWFKTLSQMYAKLKLLHVPEKNISLIFPNGRGCWASLSLQSRDPQGPAVYLFSALEQYYLHGPLMTLSIAP